MIQSINNKNLAQALLGSQGEAAAVDPELMLENMDFANELAANMASEDLMQVAPVEVAPENALELPSELLNNLNPAQTNSVSPKVINPELSNGVGEILQPKTTGISPGQVSAPEIPTNVSPEVEQAMLKMPQVKETAVATPNRSPAVDLSPVEIDPQLNSMEDFVAQKNLVNKKVSPQMPYGQSKPQLQKVMEESGLKATQVISDATPADGTSAAGSQSVNSQQFLLGLNIEQSSVPKGMDQASNVAPVKTFDMSHIKTDNANQIMNQITDYIVQSKAAKEPTLNMRVNHEELGLIDITVQKTAGVNNEAIAVNIGTHSVDGKNFFQTNSKDLFSHLTNAGLNISEVKVETSSQTSKNDFDFNGQSKGGFGQDRQFNSESNQRRHDSQRRQDLWDLLKDKEAA